MRIPHRPRSVRPWLALMILSLLVAFLLAPGCGDQEQGRTFQGYAEAEFTYLASPLSGHLVELAVRRGQRVDKGSLVFRLEAEVEAQAAQEAADRLAQAQQKLADMRKGARPSELAALEAQLASARSQLALSSLEFERRQKLFGQKSIPQADLDRARTQYQHDQAQVRQMSAQLQTARLGARSDAIKAAEAEVEALAARLAQARWNLGQASQSAPAAGLVHDTFYTPGELVQAGRPVASLLIPGNLKVRFFVGEPLLASLKLGQEVALACDGCDAGLRARISYISTQAEYTPPVIYSAQTQAKLVFMAEATPPPGQALALHPGQPVQVSLAGSGEGSD